MSNHLYSPQSISGYPSNFAGRGASAPPHSYHQGRYLNAYDTIRVSNLSTHAKADDICYCFGRVGCIRDLSMSWEYRNGPQCAIIRYTHQQAARDAIRRFNGMKLNAKRIHVCEYDQYAAASGSATRMHGPQYPAAFYQQYDTVGNMHHPPHSFPPPHQQFQQPYGTYWPVQ